MLDALYHLIQATLWCEHNLHQHDWKRSDNYFYFRQVEDLMRFKLTWL